MFEDLNKLYFKKNVYLLNIKIRVYTFRKSRNSSSMFTSLMTVDNFSILTTPLYTLKFLYERK